MNFADNDSRFAQTVYVEPDTTYKLSGWIRTEDMGESGRGANLSVEGVYAFSESVWETDGWQYIETYGRTGEDQDELTIFVRLGGYSGTSTGSAWFDNISLVQTNHVPSGYSVPLWTTEPTPIDPVGFDDDEEEAASPFWPWLIVIGLLYAVAAALMCPWLQRDEHDLSVTSTRMPLWTALGLLLSFILHLIIAQLVDGYQVDVNCFVSWGNTMASSGAANFYTATSFCDYPPAYVWVLGLNSRIASALGALTGYSPLFRASVIHKLVPSLCDLLLALLAYHMTVRQKGSRLQGSLMCLLVAFHPVLIMNSAAWCQMDSVLVLLLALVAWLAIEGKWGMLMPVYMLAVLIKPQALMLGFLGLTAIIVAWLRHPVVRRQMLMGALGAIVLASLVVIPFSVHQGISWLFELYGSTLSSYAYTTVNTANLYYLFNLNWVSIHFTAQFGVALALSAFSACWGVYLWFRQKGLRLCLAECLMHFVFAAAFLLMGAMGVSYAVIGYLSMAWCFAVILPLYMRGGSAEHLPLLGGLLFLLLYVLGIKMHERYLFPALAFFAMAYILKRDKRILVMLVLASFTMLVNEGIVLDNSVRLGSAMGHLNNDTRMLNNIISVLNVLLVPFSLWTVHECVTGCETSFAWHLPVRRLEPSIPYTPDSSLHWTKKDTLLMLMVTVAYALLAYCNLGSTKAPQHPWKSTANDEYVIMDLGEVRTDFTMTYFAQVSYSDFSVAVSNDAEYWTDEYWCEMAQGQCFRWKYAVPYTQQTYSRSYNSSAKHTFTGRYVRLTAHQIGLILNEVIFRDAELNVLPAKVILRENANEASPLYSDPNNLLDEQDTLEGEPSWYNSTYFDEIYHARTAYEHLTGASPYETTHPPLGKVLMSWCIALFGMTPFGWRFAGCTFGVLMLPAMYLLGKQLTKRTDMAFLAMCLMTLDCMHLTQTRIATIDSFPVLFIILSWFFMLRFIQHDLAAASMKELLPSLSLCGLMFGLSVASKWIGLYSGAGLAIVYFWHCIRAVRSARSASTTAFTAAFRRVITLCLWCLLFFILIPVVVYLLSYIPYLAPRHITGLKAYIEAVIAAGQGMFSYHSTPGLGMDHPFYSPWYEWPTIVRPMFYANSQYVPRGFNYAIFCLGNPAVWYTGIGGMVFLLAWFLGRHRYTLEGSPAHFHLFASDKNPAAAFVLLGFAAQFLPWVIVPRGTYIYHYFASLPFLMISIMLFFHVFTKRFPRIGHTMMILLLIACVAFFIGFYPYASGVTVPVEWLDRMKRFLHVYY